MCNSHGISVTHHHFMPSQPRFACSISIYKTSNQKIMHNPIMTQGIFDCITSLKKTTKKLQNLEDDILGIKIPTILLS